MPAEVIRRLEWLLHLSTHGSVSGTCTHFRIPRSTLYRWLKRFDPCDVRSLQDNPKHPIPAGKHHQASRIPEPHGCIFCRIATAARSHLGAIASVFLCSLLINLTISLLLSPRSADAASSWNPTILANTEAFQTIDDSDVSANVQLIFGESLGESLTFDRTMSRFDFSDDLHIQGNLTGSGGLAIEENIRAKGNLTINSDNGAEDAALTFGNASLPHTLKFMNTSQEFRFSTSLNVAGTISGSTLRAGNMALSGAVVYSSGSSLQQTAQGMSGQLLISQGASAPIWTTPVGGMVWYLDGTQSVRTGVGAQVTMPFSVTLESVTLNAKGAPTGSALIVDVNMGGSSIFSTRPQIDAGATTGGSSAVFSQTEIPVNALMTVDVDQVGSTSAGSGVTIILRGTRRY